MCLDRNRSHLALSYSQELPLNHPMFLHWYCLPLVLWRLRLTYYLADPLCYPANGNTKRKLMNVETVDFEFPFYAYI